MRTKAILALAIGCLIAAACHGQPAEARSPLSWLGFGKQKSPSAKTTEVAHKPQTPALFARMTDGTQRFVGNTKKLFVPEKPPAKRRGVTAVHPAHRPEPPKQSFFQRLFHPEPAPPPKTVNEWMKLDHVHP